MGNQAETVRACAGELGFHLAGITSGRPVTDALTRLEAWCEKGYAGSMHYMDRDPPQRATPATIHKRAGSVISLAVNYWHPAPPFEHKNRFGRVARYAWGKDYHDVVLPKLRTLGERLEQRIPSLGRVKAACDHSPILERAFAIRAGLGFAGKNTCVLIPKRGSWYFLAELIVEAELETDTRPSESHCGTCTDCMPACPTNAFPEPYVLDARKCISYLTIESGEPIPRHLRSSVGSWIFGCDVCQDVCPFNRFESESDWPELAPDQGAGPRLDVVELLGISSRDAFLDRFQGTPMARPGRAGLLRNAAVVARNIECHEAVPVLTDRLTDESPLIRVHALWALAGLDELAAVRLAPSLAQDDQSPWVRDEAQAILRDADA